MKLKSVASALALLVGMPAFAQSLEGTYRSSYGELRLVEQGGIVFGDYANTGVIVAKREGDAVTGYFTNEQSGRVGEIRFDIEDDGDAFAGEWNWINETTKQNWEGSLTSDSNVELSNFGTPDGQADFAGRWSSSFGELTFRSYQNVHAGFYADRGIFFAASTPDGIAGTFTNGMRKGKFAFAKTEAGFDGIWTWGETIEGATNTWTGSLIESFKPLVSLNVAEQFNRTDLVLDREAVELPIDGLQQVETEEKEEDQFVVLDGLSRPGIDGQVLIDAENEGLRATNSAIAEQIGNLDLYQPSNSEAFPFDPDGEKLIVLVHGIASDPAPNPKQALDKPAQVVNYWGWDFVRLLSGEQIHHDFLTHHFIQPSGLRASHSLKAGDWHVCDPELSDNAYGNCEDGKWYNRLAKFKAYENLGIMLRANTQSARAGAKTWIMGTYRNGAEPGARQIADTMRQVCDTYDAFFKDRDEADQPDILFLTHSFGGIVARGIMAGPDWRGLDTTNVVSADERSQLRECADFIKRRTRAVAAIAAPHDGSPAASFGAQMTQMLRQVQADLKSEIDRLPEPFGADPLNKPSLKRQVDEVFNSAIDRDVGGDRAVLNNIRDMDAWNAGAMRPDRMKRPDGSPIPIYTLTGQNPGGNYFLSSKEIIAPYDKETDLLDIAGSSKRGFEAAMLQIIDGLMRLVEYDYSEGRGRGVWGLASPAIPSGDIYNAVPNYSKIPKNRITDYGHVARTFLQSAYNANPILNNDKRLGNLTTGLLLDVDKQNYLVLEDGEWDSDGFVGFDSAHGLTLDGSGKQAKFSGGLGPYDASKGGNWYRIIAGTGYGDHFPWLWDNHGSETRNPGTALWLRRNLISRVGPEVSVGLFSGYPGQSAPTLDRGSTVLTLSDIKELRDCDDALSDGDHTILLQINAMKRTHDVSTNGRSNIGTRLIEQAQTTGGVATIRVQLWDRDELGFPPIAGGHSLAGTDLISNDLRNTVCSLSQTDARDDLILYYDVDSKTLIGEREVGPDGKLLPNDGIIRRGSANATSKLFSGNNRSQNNTAQIRVSVD